jgi:hypothetical protein
MDINKAGILILLLMLPLANAAGPLTIDDNFDINFEDVEWVGTSVTIPDTEARHVFLSGKGIPGEGIGIRMSPTQGNSPLNNTYLTLACGNFSTDLVGNATSTWSSKSYAVILWPSIVSGSSTWSTTGDYCIATAQGQDLEVTFYHLPQAQYAQVPSVPLENIVVTASGITQAAFDLLQLMLIIFAMLLLFFLIIFTWKVFEFFIRRVRAR